jgi:hypothetical protein
LPRIRISIDMNQDMDSDELSAEDFEPRDESGTWDYASYWACYPGMVIDELYRHLAAQASDY